MKILFFHRWTGVHLGGTETHVRELAEQFINRGHEVSILTREGESLNGLDPRIMVYQVRRNFRESDHSYETKLHLYYHTALFMLKSFFHLLYLRLIKSQRFDVISVHFATEALVAYLYRFLFGVPDVFVLEGYTSLEAKMAKYANVSIAISHHEVEETEKNHGYRPFYLPKGRNPRFGLRADGRAIREYYLKGAEKLIITVGRIESRKDYPTLVAVAQEIKKRGKIYRWLVAGDGIDFDKVNSLIEKEGLSEEVVMLGAVSNPDLPQYYRAGDLFFLPTLYEGFGFVYVEAMACGLPVVSTTVGAVPEVVGGAGLLGSPKDVVGLADLITRIFKDAVLYQKCRAQALAQAELYDWQVLMPQYEKVYQGVLL